MTTPLHPVDAMSPAAKKFVAAFERQTGVVVEAWAVRSDGSIALTVSLSAERLAAHLASRRGPV